MEEQTQEQEQVTVKAVEDNTPAPTPQEREAEVLEKAVSKVVKLMKNIHQKKLMVLLKLI